MESASSTTVSPDDSMARLLEVYPGARRALFRKYHIGGCSSCGFSAEETLRDVCARSGDLNVDEVLAQIRRSHEQDEQILISPEELAEQRKQQPDMKILDVRSRTEFEAVRIEGSTLMNQETMQQILAHWPRSEAFVIVDHTGAHSLDAAAYFAGHGFENVRCLRGGIDAWARQIDPGLRRYQIA